MMKDLASIIIEPTDVAWVKTQHYCQLGSYPNRSFSIGLSPHWYWYRTANPNHANLLLTF